MPSQNKPTFVKLKPRNPKPSESPKPESTTKTTETVEVSKTKEQGHATFVQIKAKFLPQRNSFTFVEQLAPPLEDAPKFLKASKDDKASLQKSKKSR